jgi:O-antigen/teichoic acid export membrane protein
LGSSSHFSRCATNFGARFAFLALPKFSQAHYNSIILAMFRRTSIHVKGTTGLAIAAVIMIAVLIGFPAYRLFLAISLGIGIIVALILHLRNRYRPIGDKDVENKRPLGLD